MGRDLSYIGLDSDKYPTPIVKTVTVVDNYHGAEPACDRWWLNDMTHIHSGRNALPEMDSVLSRKQIKDMIIDYTTSDDYRAAQYLSMILADCDAPYILITSG